MSDKYNGWTNWETWNCNLWFDDYFADDAANMYAIVDDESEAIVLLESLIEDTIRELVAVPDSGFAADIIDQALRAVNFREIAEHYIDDVVSEVVYG
jgi:hypothetical protein